MSDDDGITTGERIPSLMAEHRLTILICLSIVIALVFTAVGLTLYNTSGTAQLDLSRPGFEGIDKQIKSHKADAIEYSATGPINEETLLQFDILYKKQLENVTSVNAFGGDPMAPDALGIDDVLLEESE